MIWRFQLRGRSTQCWPSAGSNYIVAGSSATGPLAGLFEMARQLDVSVEALTWRIHRVYGGKPKDKPRTEAMIERARAAATLFESER